MAGGKPRPRGFLAAFSAFVYVFLYAPILVLVVFSFNKGRLTAQWEGFTLAWYVKLFGNPQILSSLRNSLIVAAVATAVCTVVGTAAALAVFRHRFRRQAALDALVTIPIVVPEIVLASSLVLLFAALGLRLGFLTIILAHVAFSVSYAVVVVKARFAGFDRSLEEAAMDLGAGPSATFFRVTLPGIAPGVLAAALLVFSLSIDDYVITSFVAGVGTTTLPIQIYSMVRSGITPEINAVSTLLLVATSLLLLASHRLERGRSAAGAAVPALFGLALLATPFAFGRSVASGEKVLNLYIWSNYIAPETVRKFEARFGVHVNVDLYDTNEAMLAKVQTGNVSYDLLCPSSYPIETLIHQNLLRPLDHSALPHLSNIDPRFLDNAYDRGNRYSVPYFWGTCGIAYDRKRVATPDSWAVLWDPRYRGRILMLDDPREGFGSALRWMGESVNATDPAVLRKAEALLLRQKPLVKTYNASNFEDVLLSRDVWLAQGWNGQFAKVMAVDPDLDYTIPKEGASYFIDSLVIPASAPHPDMAHAFIDWVLEPEVAAEICRTMRYSTPNQAAIPLLPAAIRDNRAIFPPADVVKRLELIHDVGETTVLYERLWTEVKTGG
jgi:spermidine/putrescine transport system substrate-binding protein/spermidine/putrescine transport system permease protein